MVTFSTWLCGVDSEERGLEGGCVEGGWVEVCWVESGVKGALGQGGREFRIGGLGGGSLGRGRESRSEGELQSGDQGS